MRALIEAFGTAEDVWKASDGEIVESHLLKGKTEASFLAYRKETEPEEIGEKLYRLQIRCVTWEDDLYPPLLQTTANPPAVLFYKGNNPVFEKTVAIVGSRKATPYGVQTAERIACSLAENGVTVVSGGARGIDSAAHEGHCAEKARRWWRLPAGWIMYILRKIKICSKKLLIMAVRLFLNTRRGHRL